MKHHFTNESGNLMCDDYIRMSAIASASPFTYQFALAVFLVTVRCFTALAVLQRITAFVSPPARVAIALALSWAAVSGSSPLITASLPEPSAALVLALALTEVLLGLLLSLPTAFALEALPAFGRIADTVRGNQIAEQLVPDIPDRVSPLEYLSTFFAALVFFETGAAHRFFSALLSAGLSSGPGSTSSVQTVHTLLSAPSLDNVLVSATSALTTGLAYAAPVLLVCISIDALLVGLARTMPRIQFAGELSVLKLLAGLVAAAIVIAQSGLSQSGFGQ